MNRIERTFSTLSARKEKALTLFLTAGFPSIDSTVDLVLRLEQSGADIIELGMPFSDPLADGQVIQQSSAIALHNGVNLEKIFGYVRRIRESSDMPVVLMGYLNPVLSFGRAKFFSAAAQAGVDGIILPEVSLEEARSFRSLSRANGLSHILLVSPTASSDRIVAIDRASTGFLYCVSTTGVTGVRGGRQPSHGYVKRVKLHAKNNPVQVGFGISSPGDAKAYAAHADGVIVGSALIQEIMRRPSGSSLHAWTKAFKRAIT